MDGGTEGKDFSPKSINCTGLAFGDKGVVGLDKRVIGAGEGERDLGGVLPGERGRRRAVALNGEPGVPGLDKL